MKDKENAKADFLNMIHRSWTWGRMTEEERGRFTEMLFYQIAEPTGTYKQRWQQLNNVYTAYLYGIGYTHSGWREEATA